LQLARDFVMLDPLHFVQIKNLPAALGKFLDGAMQGKPIDSSGEIQISCANIAFQRWRLGRNWLVQGEQRRRFAAPQLHEHRVHCNPVEPSRKGRIAAKRIDIAKHLQESFLSQVFRIGYVLRHLQADGVHTLLMQLEECGESVLISALRASDEVAFRIISLSFSSRWD